MRAKTADQTAKKKEGILQCGRELMLERGYAAVSIDDICKCAGVTKGCFFHYFKNKEDLVRELVGRFTDHVVGIMADAACGAGDDPLKRVYDYVDCVIEMSRDPRNKGCLVGTLVQERGEFSKKLQDVCCHSLERFVGAFKKVLEAAAKKKPRCNCEELAECFVAIMQGSMVMIKATGDRKVMERNLTQYKRYLQAVLEG